MLLQTQSEACYDSLNEDLLVQIASGLGRADLRNLRLVNRASEAAVRHAATELHLRSNITFAHVQQLSAKFSGVTALILSRTFAEAQLQQLGDSFGQTSSLTLTNGCTEDCLYVLPTLFPSLTALDGRGTLLPGYPAQRNSFPAPPGDQLRSLKLNSKGYFRQVEIDRNLACMRCDAGNLSVARQG